MSSWEIALAAYIGTMIITFVPVASALLRRVKLHPGGPSFADSGQFSDSAAQRLEDHWNRLHGTLIFWKNQASKYHRFHNYALVWTIASSVLIPVLVQAARATQDSAATWLITVVSASTALLLGFSRGFKVEQNYRLFREGESTFYDTYRRLLDTPSDFGASEVEQLTAYFERTALIREHVRNGEIDNLPSLEDFVNKASTPT